VLAGKQHASSSTANGDDGLLSLANEAQYLLIATASVEALLSLMSQSSIQQTNNHILSKYCCQADKRTSNSYYGRLRFIIFLYFLLRFDDDFSVNVE
jgi:hypothetical protein